MALLTKAFDLRARRAVLEQDLKNTKRDEQDELDRIASEICGLKIGDTVSDRRRTIVIDSINGQWYGEHMTDVIVFFYGRVLMKNGKPGKTTRGIWKSLDSLKQGRDNEPKS